MQPKFDPSLSQDEGLEDGESSLPTKESQDGEFRPFIRRLPEFKFWHDATRAVLIGFLCSWFEVFNLPVFWPVLVVYWLILFSLTSMFLTPVYHKTFATFPLLFSSHLRPSDQTTNRARFTVRRQIQHMIKYRYVPFSIGKTRYGSR